MQKKKTKRRSKKVRKIKNLDPLITSEGSNELFNAIFHTVSGALAIAGMIVLIVLSAIHKNWMGVITFSIYGTTLILSFIFSSLLHFFLAFGKYIKALGVLDHDAIYVLIAGTYTPISLVVIKGALGWTTFGVVWGLAVLGIVLKSVFFGKMNKYLSMLGYLIMGWLSVVLIYAVYTKLGLSALLWMIAGGVFYTLGGVIFLSEKPKILGFGNHELWHVLVTLGSFCFFMVMLLYVVPY